MAFESAHVSTHISQPADAVYEFASDPTNLPRWAPGLCSSVERIDGQWIAQTPMGRVTLTFAPRNAFGVIDHDVTMSSGSTVHNPMRVLPDGTGTGSEIVFSVRRQSGMTDEEFARDARAVQADLDRLRDLLEQA